MLYYLPETFDFKDYQDDKPVVKIDLVSGGFITAESVDYNHVRIWTINSTNPMDYLDSRYQPGEILELGLRKQFAKEEDSY